MHQHVEGGGTYAPSVWNHTSAALIPQIFGRCPRGMSSLDGSTMHGYSQCTNALALVKVNHLHVN
eukprot:scaffold255610_cov43-Tisochrysis_lutea.AAC.3